MDLSSGLQIVLVEPEIPPNTGNIARLCAATKTPLHLIEPLGFELSDRTLKRAGMDYWQHCEWKTWKSFEELRQAYPKNRFLFFTTKTKRSYFEIKFKEGDFLVFGRETKGLPESLLKANESFCVNIPILNPEVRSLNLATAVSVALYEGIRQSGAGR